MGDVKYGVATRIDIELNNLLRELAKKNDMSIRQASRKLAKISKRKLTEEKISDDILF